MANKSSLRFLSNIESKDKLREGLGLMQDWHIPGGQEIKEMGHHVVRLLQINDEIFNWLQDYLTDCQMEYHCGSYGLNLAERFTMTKGIMDSEEYPNIVMASTFDWKTLIGRIRALVFGVGDNVKVRTYVDNIELMLDKDTDVLGIGKEIIPKMLPEALQPKYSRVTLVFEGSTLHMAELNLLADLDHYTHYTNADGNDKVFMTVDAMRVARYIWSNTNFVFDQLGLGEDFDIFKWHPDAHKVIDLPFEDIVKFVKTVTNLI